MLHKWGTSQDPAKAELMSRKWWAMLCMATELMEGLEKKPARIQLFDKSFFNAWIPRSMDGVFSKTASSLVEKVDMEFILPLKIKTIDGRKQPERTDENTMAHGHGVIKDESTRFDPKGSV